MAGRYLLKDGLVSWMLMGHYAHRVPECATLAIARQGQSGLLTA